MSQHSRTAAIRSELLDKLRPRTVAWSASGRVVEYIADFDLSIEAGDFLEVRTPAGDRLLVQVHDRSVVTRQGITVELDAEELGFEAGGLRQATVNVPVRVIEGRGVVVGRLDGRRAPIRGFDESDLMPADPSAVADYFARHAGKARRIEIGSMRGSSVPAALRATGFARHTFMCGQSGSGKTFSLGVVLERLLYETDLPVVIVDPNSDYVNLGRVESRTTINRFATPPLTREDHDRLSRTYPERAQVVVASAREGDLPLRIHLSDLTIHEQALTMRLDPIENPGEYHALVEVTSAFGDDVYDIHDLSTALRARFDEDGRHLAQRIANLGVAEWSVWARSDETSLAGSNVGEYFAEGRRVIVLDTGSLATTHERSVVALALLGRLRRRPFRKPVSIVIDEAHNVCPPEAVTSLDQAVVDLMLWIAGEGRKYGLYLLLSTQRPQKIHRNVLSQCDNLLLMRVNSDGDLDELTSVFSHVPPALIHEARSHQMGEMLAAGPVAPTPLRLQVGVRWTKEGGADLPTTWATRTD